MKSRKYAFAGNRAFVLQRMRELGLNISEIWAVKGSYLERYLDKEGLNYKVIEDKIQFLEEIKAADFDLFVSNGLPMILPKELLDNDSRKFINIHPSLLPDLRGRDPIPGAILYRRDSGATCHIMNKDIDSGDIISQVEIPYSDDLDAGLLYQLSFKAEADVFECAYEKDFIPIHKQALRDTDIYYSYKPMDMDIDLSRDTAETVVSKVHAFSTGNKGARIYIDNKIFVCNDVKRITNPYMKEQYKEADWGKILLQYENRIVVKNAFNELICLTLKNAIGGGINRDKLIYLFSVDRLWFPLIVNVIEQNQTGKIFVNDNNNPTHAFVVNKFGFCQEAYEEYDNAFFTDVIRPYIESKNRMKLRMYNPGKYMQKYLSTLPYASKSTRVHMQHIFENIEKEEMSDYEIREMTKEDVLKEDLGLDLASRYYEDVDDFIKNAKAMAAYSKDGETLGIVYSAAGALGVCEKDILVKPQFRGIGIAKRLTRAFMKKCNECNELVSEDIYENNYSSIALAKATGAEFIAKYDYYNIEKI